MYLHIYVLLYLFNYVYTYLCIYVILSIKIKKQGGIYVNSNLTPFKKRENPLAGPSKVVASSDREKYTATMDRDLRKKLKVAAAMKGQQVSSFIEEAIADKLEREGY